MDEYKEIDDTGIDDDPIPTEEIVTANAFMGKIPLDVILEGIDNQFSDYIELTDRTNYVEIFYRQLDESYVAVEDDYEEHPAEIKEFLLDATHKFTSHMIDLFNKKLSLHIADSEDLMTIDDEEHRRIFQTIYEGMILNARSNFMTAITRDILSKIDTQLPKNYTDDDWYDTIHQMLEGYSPIILEISPLMFLKYIGNKDLTTLYEDGFVTGNFLRKYSPRLFQNTEFEVELVSNITLVKDVKEDLYASNTK